MHRKRFLTTAFYLLSSHSNRNACAMAFTKRNGHSLRTTRAASGSGGADVSLGASSSSSTSNNLITAPIPRRDETLVTLAGKVLTTNFIRQSEESENALLDPPRSVPNPYGWVSQNIILKVLFVYLTNHKNKQ